MEILNTAARRLVFAYTGLLTVSFINLALPPRPFYNVDASATCVRVERFPSRAVAHLRMGSERRQVSGLIRLDQRTQNRYFYERAFQSASIQSESGNTSIFETVFLSRGVFGKQYLGVADFEYISPRAEYQRGHIAQYRLQLNSELFLRDNRRFWLTSTAFCTAPLEESATGGLDVFWGTDGRLFTNLSSLLDVPMLAHVPIVQEATACAGVIGDVELFPVAASYTPIYLSLADEHLGEHQPRLFSERQRVVELGRTCAAEVPSLQSADSLYEIDCSHSWSSCASTPSIPLYRIANYEIYFELGASDVSGAGNGKLFFTRSNSLEQLTGRDGASSGLLSIIKFCLLLFASVAMWVRGDDMTSLGTWQLKHCLKLVGVLKQKTLSGEDIYRESVSTLEDAVVGVMGLFARAMAVGLQWHHFNDDGLTRVLVVECFALSASAVSWGLRYVVITSQDVRAGPLTQLGGSTVLVDAIAAVLIIFTSTPILSPANRFDDVARLLVGLTIVLVLFQRTAFAIVCNEVVRLSINDPTTSCLRLIGVFVWIAQGLSISTLLTDLVVYPFSFAIERTIAGEAWAVRFALFLMFFAAGLPRLLSSTRPA